MSLYILMTSQDLSISRLIQSYHVSDLKKKSRFSIIHHIHTTTAATTTTTTTNTKSTTTKILVKGGEQERKSKNLLYIGHWQSKETQETQMYTTEVII